MTENNKVSALAFAVLILGMLGFFVAVAVDLFLATSAPAVVAPATPTAPRELENKVMHDRASVVKGIRQEFEFTVTGSGQFLPEDRAQRVEEVIGDYVSFGRGSATLATPQLQKCDGVLERVRERSSRANIKERCSAAPAKDSRSSKRGPRRGFANTL